MSFPLFIYLASTKSKSDNLFIYGIVSSKSFSFSDNAMQVLSALLQIVRVKCNAEAAFVPPGKINLCKGQSGFALG